jgi:putative glutamine amidotransferase
MAKPPLIGITCDVGLTDSGRPRAQCALTYQQAVVRAGGVPVLLAPLPELAERYVATLDGLVLTGGDDIDPRPFGGQVHPAATLMHPQRQAFEFALLEAIDRRAALPVLGICMGMQCMGVHRGGTLQQHLPDVLPTAQRHRGDFHHPIEPAGTAEHALRPGTVASSHHQALAAAGRLRCIALSDDGVIEAVEDPSRPFYLGVQWHPERTTTEHLGDDLFRRLVAACGR